MKQDGDHFCETVTTTKLNKFGKIEIEKFSTILSNRVRKQSKEISCKKVGPKLEK